MGSVAWVRLSTVLATVLALLSALVAPGAPAARAADPASGPVKVTLLHTNDLHSRFRPEKTALNLGGIARLKTLLDRLRGEEEHVLLADGGDFSEGSIHYLAGAGIETLRLMDHLGYDVAVVGNHDWLNGPDALLDSVAAADTRIQLISANTSAENYHRERDYRRYVHPYSIRQVGGVKIAFVGISTYEIIYDRWLKPVKVHAPFDIARRLSKRLKTKADVVVGVSHNKISMNEQILRQAPDMDLIIGAHDHVKLTQPVVVKRPGADPAWVVEAGSWGRWLGRVDLEVTPSARGRAKLRLAGYRLYQIDPSIPDDAETLARLERIESDLETRYGPLFDDHVCHSEIEAGRGGPESAMGNLVTDALLDHTGADLALEQVNFVSGHIYRGSVTTADVFNSNPGVWSPETDKAWTVHELPIKGRTLMWIFNLLFSSSSLGNMGILSAAGLELTYNPAFSTMDAWRVLQAAARGGAPLATSPFGGLFSPMEHWDLYNEETRKVPVREAKIGGKPVRAESTYRLAASGGIIGAVEFLNSLIPNAVPLSGLRDTGEETWRVMRNYLRRMGTFSDRSVRFGGRIRSEQEDLVVLSHEIRWSNARASRDSATADIEVLVRNLGSSASPASGVTVRLYRTGRPLDTTSDQPLLPVSEAVNVPRLAPGAVHRARFPDVTLKGGRGIYPVHARIDGSKNEVNRANDAAAHWFTELNASGRPSRSFNNVRSAGAK